MATDYVLIPLTPPTTAACYHQPHEPGTSQPYCTRSETYERASLQTALAFGLRPCQRSEQKDTTRTTTPECGRKWNHFMRFVKYTELEENLYQCKYSDCREIINLRNDVNVTHSAE